jgi:hypothetical protein
MPFDVAERYVQAAEEALGISLPASYRLAMMRRNGGFIATESDDWDLYPIADDSDRRRLARTFNGVVPETERARTWHGFPSTAVALGGNGGGDKLVFIMGGGCLRPEVFIWRHETGELLRVADDFGDLVPPGS